MGFPDGQKTFREYAQNYEQRDIAKLPTDEKLYLVDLPAFAHASCSADTVSDMISLIIRRISAVVSRSVFPSYAEAVEDLQEKNIAVLFLVDSYMVDNKAKQDTLDDRSAKLNTFVIGETLTDCYLSDDRGEGIFGSAESKHSFYTKFERTIEYAPHSMSHLFHACIMTTPQDDVILLKRNLYSSPCLHYTTWEDPEASTHNIEQLFSFDSFAWDTDVKAERPETLCVRVFCRPPGGKARKRCTLSIDDSTEDPMLHVVADFGDCQWDFDVPTSLAEAVFEPLCTIIPNENTMLVFSVVGIHVPYDVEYNGDLADSDGYMPVVGAVVSVQMQVMEVKPIPKPTDLCYVEADFQAPAFSIMLSSWYKHLILITQDADWILLNTIAQMAMLQRGEAAGYTLVIPDRSITEAPKIYDLRSLCTRRPDLAEKIIKLQEIMLYAGNDHCKKIGGRVGKVKARAIMADMNTQFVSINRYKPWTLDFNYNIPLQFTERAAAKHPAVLAEMQENNLTPYSRAKNMMYMFHILEQCMAPLNPCYNHVFEKCEECERNEDVFEGRSVGLTHEDLMVHTMDSLIRRQLERKKQRQGDAMDTDEPIRIDGQRTLDEFRH